MECKFCGSVAIRLGTRKGKQKWQCKSCGKNFTFGEKRIKKEKPIEFNFSLGYVIGVLVGDGSLSKWKDYHYFDDKHRQVPKAKATKIVPRFRHGFQLQVKDEDFAVAFQDQLEKVTGKRACLCPIQGIGMTTRNMVPIPYTFHRFKVQLISKEWHDKIKPLLDDLLWINKSALEVKLGFLRGFFDSEGGYGSWGSIKLTNTNMNLLRVSKKLLNELNINCTIYADKNNSKIYKTHKISILRIPKCDSNRFLETVGFSIKRKNKKIRELLRFD